MSKQKKYADKVALGNQMYGPGCCAHTVTAQQIERARQNAYRNGAGLRGALAREELPRYAGRFLRMPSKRTYEDFNYVD